MFDWKGRDGGPARRMKSLVATLWALVALPTTLLGQAPAEEGAGPEEVAPAIEWNFERVAPVVAPDAALHDRWAAPFAVVSQGRPSPREPREVVVREGSAPVGPQDSTATMAIVRVEEAEEAEEVDEEVVPADSDTGEAETAEASGEGAAPAARVASAGGAGPGASSGSAGGAARTHRVAYGETWFGLVREYRLSSAALAAANPEVDPERLRAGTILRIPARGAEVAQRRTHTVARGDTLFGIARRYGVTAAAIRSANDLSGDVVRLGQTLVIPQEEAGG